MKEIELFGNRFGDIRTFKHQTELYFVGIDVAKALGYSDAKQALDHNCTMKIKGGYAVPPLKLEIDLKDANGRMQTYRLIDEPNLYKLIFASKKSLAQDFTSWVAGDVLPTIREYGCYPKPEKVKPKVREKVSLQSEGIKEPDKEDIDQKACLTYMLRSRGIHQSPELYNTRLRALGIIEKVQHITHTHRIIDDRFGENEGEKARSRPLYYDERFDELLELLEADKQSDEDVIE